LTLTGDPVISSSGLPILPDGALADMKRSDYLIVNASYGFIEHNTSKTRIAIQQAAKLAQTVVGLDTGPWLMAAAGLLSGKIATVHWDIFEDFAENFPLVDAQRLRVVQDDNRLTCAGAMSTFDLSLYIINKHLGNSSKVDIEAFFIHQESHNISQVPRQTARNPLLNKAVDLMHANIESPLSRDVLSRRLSCQAKTLDRRCLAEFGAPSGQIYRHIRLTAAQQMVTSTSLSILEVSLRSGFQNASAMTRAYKARFGVTPTQNRQSTRNVLSNSAL
jgi:transcriptional regulator GlxA family with amidase domain